jgi:elongation factor 1-beta
MQGVVLVSCAQNAHSMKLLEAQRLERFLLNMSAQVAVLKVQTKMANVVITIKIMPESPEVDLAELQTQILHKIKEHGAHGDTKVDIEPVAFGLKALVVIFVIDEKKGGTDTLEEAICSIHGVESCQTTDVRRAIG